MQFSAWCLARHDGAYRTLKAPGRQVPPAQHDPAVVARVTEMLTTIEREGLDAVLRYAKELDHFDGDQLELDRADIARSGDELDPALRRALELGAERTRAFATAHRQALSDFDVELAPGLRAGYRYVPVSRVGAYLPAGRFPLLASAFMTVGVAKAAGVAHGARLHAAAARRRGRTRRCCTPPTSPAPTASSSSAASRRSPRWPSGCSTNRPSTCSSAPATPTSPRRSASCSGAVAIDLLAGPSEVAVIADETADPEIVAADLLGQAEHGPDSPAALVTTSEAFGRAVIAAVEQPARHARHARRSPGRPGATTARSRGPPTRRPPSR